MLPTSSPGGLWDARDDSHGRLFVLAAEGGSAFGVDGRRAWTSSCCGRWYRGVC